jgi:hypothetical protein
MKPINTSIPKIWRDDDPSLYTCVCEFKEIHQKFIEKKRIHTVAVCMKDLWKNHSLFYYLATAPYLDIGLHGWEHKDYSKLSYGECYDDLKKSLDYWKEHATRMTGTTKIKEIKIFFAPWNRDGNNIRQACSEVGLGFCNVKKGIWNGFEIKSFHYWSVDKEKL